MLLTTQRGLGATGGQLAATATGTAASVTGLLSSSLVGVLPAVAGPIGAAIAGLVGLLAAFGVGSGCGNSCIAASNEANAVQDAMEANLQAFLNKQISQATAESNWTQLWSQLVAGCDQVGGTAGQNCVSQRQQGACAYQTSPGGWQQQGDGSWTYVGAGANGSGTTCWNYYTGFYEPIATAPAAFTASTVAADLDGLGPLLTYAGLGLMLALVF